VLAERFDVRRMVLPISYTASVLRRPLAAAFFRKAADIRQRDLVSCLRSSDDHTSAARLPRPKDDGPCRRLAQAKQRDRRHFSVVAGRFGPRQKLLGHCADNLRPVEEHLVAEFAAQDAGHGWAMRGTDLGHPPDSSSVDILLL
jgi:hypothetical protein